MSIISYFLFFSSFSEGCSSGRMPGMCRGRRLRRRASRRKSAGGRLESSPRPLFAFCVQARPGCCPADTLPATVPTGFVRLRNPSLMPRNLSLIPCKMTGPCRNRSRSLSGYIIFVVEDKWKTLWITRPGADKSIPGAARPRHPAGGCISAGSSPLRCSADKR